VWAGISGLVWVFGEGCAWLMVHFVIVNVKYDSISSSCTITPQSMVSTPKKSRIRPQIYFHASHKVTDYA